jgi:asparagine synthase (glutamine-hydrolysing)
MCGLVGSFKVGLSQTLRPDNQDLVGLKHRGPDGDGLFVDEFVRMGHTRLAIIDLSDAGSQPMFSRDGRFVMVFNGEIYNYLELRTELGLVDITDSDSDVLLAAYQHWGAECLNRLVGMFAFAIWDRQQETLFLARDRLGEKPLYFCKEDETIYFSSELKSVLSMLSEEVSIDAESIDCFLHYQYVPEPRTLVEGVTKLPAGHFAVINRGNNEIEPVRYWSIEDSSLTPKEHFETQELEIVSKLEEAVQFCLRSDVPVGVALSGGIDSGIIAAMAQRNSIAPLHAFCIGYPGRPPYDEREKARKLATELGMIFHEVEIPVDSFSDSFPDLVRVMDEPIADPAAFGHYSIPKAVSESGIKVLLSGLGSDEIFWGYDWVRKSVVRNSEKRAKKQNHRIAKLSLSVFKFLERSHILRGRVANLLRIKHQEWFTISDSFTPSDQLNFYMNEPQFRAAFEFKDEIYGEHMDNVTLASLFRCTNIGPRSKKDIPTAQIRMLVDTWFTSNCLTLSDRVSMAFGVETRLPFANHQLLETVTRQRRLNPDHNRGNKALLRRSIEGWLPKDVIQRRKAGFQPPVTQWLQEVIERYAPLVNGGVLADYRIISETVDSDLLVRFSHQGWDRLFYAYKIVLLEVWMRQVLPVKNETR